MSIKVTLDSDLAYKILEHEGLAYAILDYFGRNINTDNDDFNEAWALAHDNLEAVRNMLEDLL